MKILMATMGLDIGGAETHIVELAKELKAEGHDIVVASLRSWPRASATTRSPCTGGTPDACSAPESC